MREFGKNSPEYEKIREIPEIILENPKQPEKNPNEMRLRKNPEKYRRTRDNTKTILQGSKQFDSIQGNLRKS